MERVMKNKPVRGNVGGAERLINLVKGWGQEEVNFAFLHLANPRWVTITKFEVLTTTRETNVDLSFSVFYSETARTKLFLGYFVHTVRRDTSVNTTLVSTLESDRSRFLLF